ncbi:MAG: O-acetylhomoserine aminocarboxypropyltransferase/cysteine synthase family protein [Fusobacteriaceae bacterium]
MNKLRFDTLQVHAGQEVDKATNSRAVPIYQTTSYVFNSVEHGENLFALKESGNIYTRLMNPTTDVLEKRIAALEGGVGALAVASGSAAITYAIMNIAGVGDNIISANTLYGGTFNLFLHTLPQYGITTTFVSPNDYSAYEKAINEKTKAIYIEALGNPNINIIDIEKVADIAHKNKIPLIIDSTFATPYLLRPADFGADIIVHSATKFIGGHGTTMGGLIIDSGKFDWEKSDKFPSLVNPDPSYHGVSYTKSFGNAAYIFKTRVTLLRDMGAAISPFNSFLLLQGLETLSIRVERHVSNTQKIVEFLEKHPKVEKVNYPSIKNDPNYELGKKYFPKGCGSIFTFNLVGDKEKTKKFADSLKLFSYLANVADAKSLVIHPATTTHSQMSEEELKMADIKPTTLRLSIGIEDAQDLIDDLSQAFDKI